MIFFNVLFKQKHINLYRTVGFLHLMTPVLTAWFKCTFSMTPVFTVLFKLNLTLDLTYLIEKVHLHLNGKIRGHQVQKTHSSVYMFFQTIFIGSY